MPIGAQEIGEHVRIARIALAAGGAIAGARRLEHIRVDRHDAEPGGEQRVDEQAGGALQGDSQSCRGRQPLEPLT
jgi:hypothetical protein